MQRLLSLATLGVLGGLVWMFLQGGGLNQLAPPPGGAPTAGPAPTQQANWSNGFGFLSPTAPGHATSASPVSAGGYQYPPPAATAAPMGAGPTIRIASFNIEVFGKTKADKPYVMGTLAEIIRQFHVVAVQEIRTQDDFLIPNFVKLINAGGRRYAHIIGDRLGNTTSTEQYVFIYDTDRIEASVPTVYTVGDPDNLLHREPLVASFRTRGVNPDEAFTFTLINVHTDPSPEVLQEELDALSEVYRVVRRAGQDEDDVIMLGDFNADDQHLGRLGQIPGVTPTIRGVYTNSRQNKLYDNIIIHQPSTTEYAGRSGVYDLMKQFNLTLAQVEQVSDHFPVWAEFSVYERDYAGNIASRRGAVR